MTVAYQQSLTNLANELRDMGYEMVVWGNNSAKYVHALIYDGTAHGELFMYLQDSAREPQDGAPIFNVAGLNAKEVDQLLKTRTYSPLF